MDTDNLIIESDTRRLLDKGRTLIALARQKHSDHFVPCHPGQQIRSKIEFFKMLTFLLLNQTLWCDHSLELSRRDDFNEWSHHRVWLKNEKVINDFNEGQIIGFGWEMRKLSWKPFCSLFLNCNPAVSSLNPMVDHLLESSQRDDSNKWSNIGFGEEKLQIE